MPKASKKESFKIESVKTPSFENQMCSLRSQCYSVARLAKLSENFPVMEIPLEHLNIYNTYDSMSLRTLAGHVESVINADMSKPIILDEDAEIMDGRHRIMHAIVYGLPTIKAVRFKVNPTPCEIVDE